MIQAFGYAVQGFDASLPGRLCRGQERWIAYEDVLPSADDEESGIHRSVVSGAKFSDDSARDALRGLPHVDISMAAVLRALVGEGALYAYCEEGHPRCTPEGALGVEEHTVARPGGSLRRWVARWTLPIETDADIHTALEAGAEVFILDPTVDKNPRPPSTATLAVPPMSDAPEIPESPLSETLLGALYLLTGFRSEERPQRRFQPAGIPTVLEHASAVVLVHLDKHGPCLGVYSTVLVPVEERLSSLANDSATILVVPFAIPPMLARWDRALWELRQDWDADTLGEFPVPAARRPEPPSVRATEE
jgi:hypothetical protein